MDHRNLDLLAFEFVKKVALLPPEAVPKAKPEPAGMRGDGAGTAFQLGEVEELILKQFDPISENPVNYYECRKDQTVGLDVEGYSDFTALVSKILSSQSLERRTNLWFLMECACKWLLGVHGTGQAAETLTAHLVRRTEEEEQDYLFHFKMDALQIQHDFSIGDTRFTVVDEVQAKDYFREMQRRRIVQKTGDENLWEAFLGGFAVVKRRATHAHARQLALREAELSADVLKCFCASHIVHTQHALPDLMHRSRNVVRLEYWSSREENIYNPTLSFQNLAGIIPIPLNEAFLKKAEKSGINFVSEFIQRRCSDDLYLEVVETIRRFAEVVSTYDDYQRITKLVSLLEGPISPRPHQGKNAGQSNVRKIATKLAPNQIGLTNKAITHGYMIRNTYVHNCMCLPIDKMNFDVLLELVRLFLLQLIKLHHEGKRNFDDIAIHFLGEEFVLRGKRKGERPAPE